MTIPVLSYKASGAGVHVDLDRLVASRMLVQANSGGGKSRAIRQLLEETHGRVMHLVIDPEGEFGTLRERFDYVIAAKTGGDAIAVPKYAKRLCRTLVELNASAILDLYDLSLDDRRWYVENFLTELMALPRDLWRPIIVVIDEMHLFAPEAGQARSAEAVTALATQGRKRGFCLVGATQRISKLHKDVAAELLNKMIGRTGLDIDVKRAGDELGMGKDERNGLKTLAPGEFYVYGPAIANSVQIVRTGDVMTSHPEAGKVGTAPPPPSAKVKSMLAKLADLPKEAEQEARTIEELKREVTGLRSQLTRAQKAGPPVAAQKIVEKPVVDQRAIDRAVASAVKPFGDRLGLIKRQVSKVVVAGRTFVDVLGSLESIDFDVAAPTNGNGNGYHTSSGTITRAPETNRPIREPKYVSRGTISSTGETLPIGERAVLVAAAQYGDEGVDRDQLSVLTGYKRSTRDAYIVRVQQKGYIELDGRRIRATDEGVAALGDDFEPLPTGEALQRYWLDRLPDGERRILEILLEADGEAVDRADLDEPTGFKRSTRDAYLQRMKSRRVIEDLGRGQVRASRNLFEEV